MAAKAKLSLIVLVLSALVLFAGLAIAKQEDPELKQCQHQCRVQQQFDEDQKEECARRCEDYHKEKKKRESEQGGGDHDWSAVNPGKGKVTLRHCQEQCERLDHGEERQLCRLRCQQRWGGREQQEQQEEEEVEKHENPYVFEDRHFSTEVKTEQGRVDLLAKFTDKSELLRGIEDYRLAILVANPNSFVVPNHFDADAVFVVTQGRGRLALIHEDERESLNIERGDIIRVRAGTPIYLINSDDNEKLFIVKLLKPVNLPGEYEVFYGAAGGEKPGSFFRAFSTAILEAEFKISADKLEEFFEKQDEGPFLKASKEQIQAMSSRKEGGHGGGIWPFGGDSKDAFNLFRKRRPSQGNKYGQLFQVDGDEFEPLKEFNLRVTYANITKGCMTAIQHNSRATKIAIVVDGEGLLEMACPHVSSKSRGYRKISSPLRPDTVFVVPPSHPFVTVASRNQNLEILCFEVNVENNVRYLLAGKGNIVQQFEKEAKELTFKAKEAEVDRIFKSQDEEFFLPGPRQQSQRGRASE